MDYDAQPEFAATIECTQAVPMAATFPPRPSRGKPAFRQILELALRIYSEQRITIERDGFDVTQGE